MEQVEPIAEVGEIMEFETEIYQRHFATIESAYLANIGGVEKEAFAFFSKFVETFESLDKEKKENFANDYDCRDAEHLKYLLENLLFEYTHRCREGELSHLAAEVLMQLDSRACAFASCLQKIALMGDTSTELRETVLARVADGYRASKSSYEMQYDVAYGEDENPRRKMDIYRPRGVEISEPLPVVLYFHGGAWAYGDRLGAVKRLRNYADSGIVFISVGYRLVGEVMWPALLDDCVHALNFVVENAENLKVDPNRIGLWGSSSGAHLASLLAAGARGAAQNRIKCFVNYCAPVSLDRHAATVTGAAREVSPVMQLLGGEHESLMEWAKQATVLNAVNERFPPSLIVHGEEDDTVPVTESELLEESLVARGVECEFARLEKCSHRIDDMRVINKVSHFFAKYL